MTIPLVMTFVGPDRAGLVNAISACVADNGGAWLESRLARLAGAFAGIVRLEAPTHGVEALTKALKGLETQGLRVTVEVGDGGADAELRETLTLELLCLDRPGIVREVTETLSAFDVNIEEFESALVGAAFTGQPMFKAKARLHAPPHVSAAELRRTLEELAGEMTADITLSKEG
jgi:glycine cleavage system regulatory protein